MKRVTLMIIALSLTGCMQTTEQIAKETAANVEICKRAGAPVDQCLANIRAQQAAADAAIDENIARNHIRTCIPVGYVSQCY